MREIKFRVWASNDDFPEGKMYYIGEDSNFLLNLNGDVLHSVKTNLHMGINYDIVWARIGYNGVELMQFTGLKDKNGEYIYEGDVVRGYHPTNQNEFLTQEVIWQSASYSAWYIRPPEGASVLMAPGTVYEILGNIYENPELLSSPSPK
jgi:uncharacterized phage protein (TIGR01671 family)